MGFLPGGFADDSASCGTGEVKLDPGPIGSNVGLANGWITVFDALMQSSPDADRVLVDLHFEAVSGATLLASETQYAAFFHDGVEVPALQQTVASNLSVTFSGIGLDIPKTGAPLAFTIKIRLATTFVEGHQLQYFVPIDGLAVLKDGELKACYKKAVSTNAVGHTDIVADHLRVLAPSPVTAGVSFALGISARDAYNNLDGDVSGAISLSTTSPSINGNDPILPSLSLAGGQASGSARLYKAGSAWINASAAGLLGSASLIVNAGPVTSLSVSPDPVTVSVGSNQQFSASAQDAFGNDAPASPTWTRTCGSVSSGGLYTAPTVPGDCMVMASQNAASDSATVHVVAGPLDHIHIVPSVASVEVDHSRSFSATGHDAFHNAVALSPSWSASCGSISAAGEYTAPSASGSCLVNATQSGITGSAAVTVTPGPPGRIEVSPVPDTIIAGDQEQFDATGYDANNNTTPISPAWSADCGSIDSSGLYTAPATAGPECSVTAEDSGLSDTVSFTIVAGPLDHIGVEGPSTLPAGEIGTYDLTGYDANDNEVPLNQSTIQYSNTTADGPQDVCYTEPGTSVTGCLAGGVTIVPAAPAFLAIDDSLLDLVLSADDPSPVYDAELTDVYGNVISIDPAVDILWSIDPAGDCSFPLGDNALECHIVGDYTISAAAAADASVTDSTGLAIVHGDVDSVRVCPKDYVPAASELAPNMDCPLFAYMVVLSEVDFDAFAFDASGNLIPEAAFNWTIDPASAGDVDAGGGLHALLEGNATLNATTPGSGSPVTGSMALQIVADDSLVTDVDIIPEFAELAAGDTLQFLVHAFAVDGFPVLGFHVAFSLSDPHVAAIDAAGLLTAHHVGETLVNATVNSVVATATVVVHAGELANLVILPPCLALSTTDPGKTFQLTVEGLDAFRNPIPSSDFVVDWSDDGNAAIGAVDANGLFSWTGAPGVVIVTASSGNISRMSAMFVTDSQASSGDATATSFSRPVDGNGTVIAYALAWSHVNASTDIHMMAPGLDDGNETFVDADLEFDLAADYVCLTVEVQVGGSWPDGVDRLELEDYMDSVNGSLPALFLGVQGAELGLPLNSSRLTALVDVDLSFRVQQTFFDANPAISPSHLVLVEFSNGTRIQAIKATLIETKPWARRYSVMLKSFSTFAVIATPAPAPHGGGGGGGGVGGGCGITSMRISGSDAVISNATIHFRDALCTADVAAKLLAGPASAPPAGIAPAASGIDALRYALVEVAAPSPVVGIDYEISLAASGVNAPHVLPLIYADGAWAPAASNPLSVTGGLLAGTVHADGNAPIAIVSDDSAPAVKLEMAMDAEHLRAEGSASATDNLRVESLDVYVDGQLVAHADGASVRFVIDSDRFGIGPYDVRAVAKDLVGNEGSAETQAEYQIGPGLLALGGGASFPWLVVAAAALLVGSGGSSYYAYRRHQTRLAARLELQQIASGAQGAKKPSNGGGK